MGWTSYNARNYTKGRIDKKAECLDVISEDYKVVKSVMVGNVFYGAVKKTREPVIFNGEYVLDENDKKIYRMIENAPVFAVVILTSVDMKDYFNFSYKIMDETVGPYYYDCPNSILKLLSPIKNEFATKWRSECKKRTTIKKELNKLPYGSKILVDGKEYKKEKYGKKTYWLNRAFCFIRPNDIIRIGYSVIA